MGKIKRLSNQAKKVGNWVFKVPEKKFLAWLLVRTPSWIETYHLTYMTFVWIAVSLLGGYLAAHNFNYLWIVSLAIVGQYITDLLDGAVGRAKNTGLVRWGFYFDHLLDFGFLCSILVGYWFAIPEAYHYVILATLVLSAAYFVHSILYFGATGKFEISSLGMGPTEMRLVLVIVNTMLAFFDKIIFVNMLHVYFWLNAIFLILSVFRAQKLLWKLDTKRK